MSYTYNDKYHKYICLIDVIILDQPTDTIALVIVTLLTKVRVPFWLPGVIVVVSRKAVWWPQKMALPKTILTCFDIKRRRNGREKIDMSVTQGIWRYISSNRWSLYLFWIIRTFRIAWNLKYYITYSWLKWYSKCSAKCSLLTHSIAFRLYVY